MNVTGRCLCGGCEFTASIKSKTFDSCHCSMCRRWSGGPGLTVEIDGALHFKNEQFVTAYSSSDWAERGFCRQCGSHLFYRLKSGQHLNIPLGVLENINDFQFSTQIYVDHKPSCYSFENKTKMMTEEDVLRAFGVIS